MALLYRYEAISTNQIKREIIDNQIAGSGDIADEWGHIRNTTMHSHLRVLKLSFPSGSMQIAYGPMLIIII